MALDHERLEDAMMHLLKALVASQPHRDNYIPATKRRLQPQTKNRYWERTAATPALTSARLMLF